MSLREYIEIMFGTQSAFADHMGVAKQQVCKWVADGWVVIDNKLYSHRRNIPRK